MTFRFHHIYVNRLVIPLIDEETEKKTIYDGESMKFSFGLTELELIVKYLHKDKLQKFASMILILKRDLN